MENGEDRGRGGGMVKGEHREEAEDGQKGKMEEMGGVERGGGDGEG